MYLNFCISKNIWQIGDFKVSKSKSIRTLSESKNIFALEQKIIVLSFVKNIAFLLRHPVAECLFLKTSFW